MQITKSKWFLPLFAVALGLVVLAAQSIGGHAIQGLESFGILVAFGALVLLGGRSETIRGLRGDGRDERFRQIDIHATAIAGTDVLARSSSRWWSRWHAGTAARRTPGWARSAASAMWPRWR